MTVLAEPGGTSVVRVSGHVDIYNAVDLREAMLNALGGDSNRLTLDVTDLRFLDSTGIGILAGACRRAQATGKSIEVVGMSAQVRRILSLAGVDRLLAAVAPQS